MSEKEIVEIVGRYLKDKHPGGGMNKSGGMYLFAHPWSLHAAMNTTKP